MSWDLRLERGEAARARIEDPGFREAWSGLAGVDPKSTWFQEPPFVLSWYEAYRSHREPVLVTGWESGELVGLLALGRQDDGRITHAGDHHAWYHGWIAAPRIDGEFAAAAASEVLRVLSPRFWRWSFLPPGAEAGWTERIEGGAADVAEHASAVWDLTAEDAIDGHLSRGLKNYINRYERQGELVLERLRRAEEISRALGVLAPWCDLRHGAIHADLPFRDDPCKLPFHEALGTAHPSVQTSVLRLDDRPLAVHLGAFDGTRLFLGLHGYDPTEGRQSPGTILLLELARQVKADGGTEIDMTPGGEAWKERYATRHRTVARLELWANSARRNLRSLRTGLTEMAKDVLARTGIEPDDVRRMAARIQPDARPGAPAQIFEIDASLLGFTEPEPEPAPFAGVDAPWLEQLLSYDEDHERGETAEFLSFALRLLDKGWRPLCATDAGGRTTVAWLQPAETRAVLEADPREEPPRVFRGRIPDDVEGQRIPEDVTLLLLAHDGAGDENRHAPLLVEAHRVSGSSRIWMIVLDSRTDTREWLLRHGRTVTVEVAA